MSQPKIFLDSKGCELSSDKLRMAIYLADGESLTNAARLIETSRQTCYNWLQDSGVQAALKHYKRLARRKIERLAEAKFGPSPRGCCS